MPGIKTSIYDGAVHVDAGTLDLTGSINTLTNGAVSAGTKIITVDGTDAADNFTAGDKIVNGANGIAIGTVASVDSATQITLKNGALTKLNDNDPISKWVPFEIAAIQTITDNTELTVLLPVNNKWIGTHLASGATWAETADDNFGARASSAGTGLADVFTKGITIEGRWKKVTVGTAESVICYLKASPAQTF